MPEETSRPSLTDKSVLGKKDSGIPDQARDDVFKWDKLTRFEEASACSASER
jgi:hypothetical protein